MSTDIDYEATAWAHYNEHRERIDKQLQQIVGTFPIRPSLDELYKPTNWTSNHWVWFLMNHTP